MDKTINNNRWLLRSIGRMHKNLIHHHIEEEGMGEVSNPLILIALHEKFENRTASQKELAAFIGVKPPTIAHSVQRMVCSGLLCKVPDPKDMRFNKISLTQKGVKKIEHCKEVIDQMDDELFKGFSEEETTQLENLLLKLLSNLEKMGAQLPKPLENKINSRKKNADE